MSRHIILSCALGLMLATRLALASQPVQVDPAFAPQLLNDTNATSSLVFTSYYSGLYLVPLVRGDFTHVNGASVSGFARLRADGTLDPNFASTFPRRILRATLLPKPVPYTGPYIEPYVGNQGAPRIIAVTASRDGYGTTRLERLLPDGAPDPSYPPIDLGHATITLLATIPGNKVMIAGYFTITGPVARSSIARLDDNGLPDPNFDAGTHFTAESSTYGLAVQPDGKVIYSVYHYIMPIVGPGWANYSLRRLNADGSADTAFGLDKTTDGNVSFVASTNPYHSIAILPDGKILAATGGLLQRFSANGVIDRTYSPAIPGLRRVDQIGAVVAGGILVQARVSPMLDKSLSVLTPSSVFLIDANGAVVRDFRTSLPADVSLELLAAAPAGPIVVRYGFPIIKPQFPWLIPLDVGAPATATSDAQFLPYFPPAVSLARPALARLSLGGVRDNTFAPVFTQRQPVTINRLAGDSAGRLVAAGSFTTVNGQPRPGLARFLADGSLDSNFLPAARAAQSTSLTLVQPDAKVILSASVLGTKDADGVFPIVSTYERLLVNGSPDPNFQPTGLPAGATLRAVDTTGRPTASGFEPDSAREENLKLFRLNSDGSRAATLSTVFSGFKLFRIYPMTAVETTTLYPYPYPSDLPDQVSDLQPLSDGKLLVSASVTAINGTKVPGFARLNTDGSTDLTYHPAVPSPDPYYSPNVQLLPGGRVLFTDQRAYGLPAATTIRLRADGSRDSSFMPLPGTTIADVIELTDGALLSSGGTQRWLANGLPDLNYSVTFDANAYNATAAESAGLIYLGGNFVAVNGQPRTGLARLVPVTMSGFTHQPQSQTVVAGRTVVFVASFGASGPVTYQWTFNGTPIAGATDTALVLRKVKVAQAGDYRLVVTAAGQTYTSAAARLTVRPNRCRLVNFSARSRVTPAGPPQIGGFVLRGDAPRPVLLRAMGRGLMDMMASGALLPKPVLRLHESNVPVAEDLGGARASGIVAQAQSLGAFALPQNSGLFPETIFGSALSLSLKPEVYTAHTYSGDASSGISLFEFYDAADADAPAAVANFSIRGHAAPGDNVLIAGFVVAGEGPLTLLIRGIGPALIPLGVTGALADPQLTLYSGSNIIATNDNWSDQPESDTVAAAAQSAGAFALPTGSRDAAILVTLEPGAYTVPGRGAANTSGELMIELYVVE